jgi:uncharacterized C2H2 Zn-finger protein
MYRKAEDRQRARELRLHGKSIIWIAAELDTAKSTVYEWTKDLPVPERLSKKTRAAKRVKHQRAVKKARERSGPRPKKDRLISSDGRWMIQKPPGYQGRTYIEGRYVFEHRYIMEQHLGRLLRSDEVVHHRNGNKLDNRLENLELIQGGSAHAKKHMEEGPILQLTCSNCGAVFSRRKAVYRSGGKSHTFCTEACHQEFYHKLGRKTDRKIGENRVPRHGTSNEYSYHGCRCDLCREAQRLKMQRWKEKSRQD